MCEDCGCQEGNERAYFGAADHHHEHPGEHGHSHGHGEHSHEHGPHHRHPGPEAGPALHFHGPVGPEGVHVHIHHHYEPAPPPPAGPAGHGPGEQAPKRQVALETRVLARNDEEAAKNRRWLAERGVTAINLISSPGSGKTTLLQKTLEGLAGRLSCAVIAGDQQTDNDARRLEGRGAPVRQIQTVSSCHLSAEQVGRVLPEVADGGVQLLVIENVGNLVCPAAFDLGESHKIALLSVTEGEDKPLKYPVLFHDAPVIVITKTDLLPHLDWDRNAALAAIEKIRPGARVIELSARTGEGLEQWLEYLESLACGP